MSGTKATYLEEQCRARGQAYVRFDYSGHGESDGEFNEGRIGSWAEDAVAILDHVVQGEAVLVGSSMGGWMAFLVAMMRPERIKGLIGIAAAPDFTEEIYARLSPEQKNNMDTQGFAMVENDYSDEPYYFPKDFYDEAKEHLVLGRKPRWGFPVHLFQGMQDKDVLPETAGRIQEAFAGVQIDVTYVEDGDHRLSRDKDLQAIDRIVRNMSQ